MSKKCVNCGKPISFLSQENEIILESGRLFCDNCFRDIRIYVNKIRNRTDQEGLEEAYEKAILAIEKANMTYMSASVSNEALQDLKTLFDRRCEELEREEKPNTRVSEKNDNSTNDNYTYSAISLKKDYNKIIVTTGDLKQDYEIIGPIYFQVSNKGIFSSTLSTLIKKYQNEIQEMRIQGKLSPEKADWGGLIGEWSVGQNDFDKAFYCCTQELKIRAAMLGADAIICMRQDIDIDTNGFSFFYLQMYGTAVKFT